MADADLPATCPDGHADTTRLLSVFASTGGAAPVAAAPAPRAGGHGGACCGGGCH